MFIKINNFRFRITSISEYRKEGKNFNTKMWYIYIKISGKERYFTFETEKEADEIIEYLDKVLQVKDI